MMKEYIIYNYKILVKNNVIISKKGNNIIILKKLGYPPIEFNKFSFEKFLIGKPKRYNKGIQEGLLYPHIFFYDYKKI